MNVDDIDVCGLIDVYKKISSWPVKEQYSFYATSMRICGHSNLYILFEIMKWSRNAKPTIKITDNDIRKIMDLDNNEYNKLLNEVKKFMKKMRKEGKL